MRQVRPGARVAMAGIKFFPWWAGPLNLLAWLKNRPYNARPADLWQPWSLVAAYCDDFRWSGTQWGMGYIASGTLAHVTIGSGILVVSRASSSGDGSLLAQERL